MSCEPSNATFVIDNWRTTAERAAAIPPPRAKQLVLTSAGSRPPRTAHHLLTRNPARRAHPAGTARAARPAGQGRHRALSSLSLNDSAGLLSAITIICSSSGPPNVVAMATSEASRPRRSPRAPCGSVVPGVEGSTIGPPAKPPSRRRRSIGADRAEGRCRQVAENVAGRMLVPTERKSPR